MKKMKKQISLFLSTAVILIIVFGGGFWFGQTWKPKTVKTETDSQYVVGKNDGKPQAVDFGLFWEAWSVLEHSYLGEMNDQDRLEGAIAGIARSTGDPYTIFLPKAENDLFQSNLTGKFSGIGAEISHINGYATIVTPLAGSPAEKAGLKPKDIIIKVDDIETENEDFITTINRIRGEEGSNVVITVVREGADEPLSITVVREMIDLESVTWEVVEQEGLKYGYLKINQFLEDSESQIITALDEFEAQKVDRLMIDLRNDPGGLLESSVNIASLFIDPASKPELKGAIVHQRGKDNELVTFTTTRTPKWTAGKVAVLINEGSASAAEILAGALSDYQRGYLIGVTTFGKGSVQELKDLSDGSSLKITVAKWLTPSEGEIDGVGIKPHQEVKMEASNSDAQRQAAETWLR